MFKKLESLLKFRNVFENWWTAALARYLGRYMGEERILRLRTGKKLCIRPGWDFFALGELFICNLYGDFLKAPAPALVWDIGGNIGCFPIWASEHSPQSIFHSFEPDPDTFNRLRRNKEANASIHWHVHPFGISGRDESCTAYRSNRSSDETSRYATEGEPVTFFLRGINSFWEEQGRPRVDWLKIDCEGGEYDILAEASAEFLDAVEMIVMEVHLLPDRDPETLRERLQAAGFHVDWPATFPSMTTARRLRKRG